MASEEYKGFHISAWAGDVLMNRPVKIIYFLFFFCAASVLELPFGLGAECKPPKEIRALVEKGLEIFVASTTINGDFYVGGGLTARLQLKI
jgi:hypothetical protein